MMAESVILFLLIVLSAFFSGSEIALFSVSDARVRGMREDRLRGSRALELLRANPERLMATLLVGNNLAKIAAAAFAASIALGAYGTRGVAYATGVITLLVLVFAEAIPKGLAAADAERFARFSAPTIHFLSRFLLPIVAPLEYIMSEIVRRRRGERATVTEGEIREMTAIGLREGAIEEHERQIIDRAFRLDETRAWDVMTPRVDIVAWPADRTLASIADELAELRLSRVPVYGETVDDIVGILYTRDAYRALVDGRSGVTLGQMSREPFFVPGSIPLTRLLRDFQTSRVHMGIVIDEYGGTDGLVTLEDILEELVGEIVDETDLEHQPLVLVAENELLAEGSCDLREINDFFGTSFPQTEHRSLNGYLLDVLGYVPNAGEEIRYDGVTFRILESSETQVLQALLSITGTRGATAGDGAVGESPAGGREAGSAALGARESRDEP